MAVTAEELEKRVLLQGFQKSCCKTFGSLYALNGIFVFALYRPDCRQWVQRGGIPACFHAFSISISAGMSF